MKNNIEIKYININDLKVYKNNPRINDNAIEPVANSIKNFGFKVPIIIDKNYTIIAGHTRYKASLKLNLKQIPCIIADELNSEQVKAFRLVDNRTSEFSTWDQNSLLNEIQALENSSPEIEALLKELHFDDEILDESLLDEIFSEQDDNSQKEKDDKKEIKCPNCGEIIEI